MSLCIHELHFLGRWIPCRTLWCFFFVFFFIFYFLPLGFFLMLACALHKTNDDGVTLLLFSVRDTLLRPEFGCRIVVEEACSNDDEADVIKLVKRREAASSHASKKEYIEERRRRRRVNNSNDWQEVVSWEVKHYLADETTKRHYTKLERETLSSSTGRWFAFYHEFGSRVTWNL